MSRVVAPNVFTEPGKRFTQNFKSGPTPDIYLDVWKPLWECTLILLTSPAWVALCLIATAAIVILDRMPPFYSQTRVGRNGNPFLCYKLRTMKNSCDGRNPLFTSANDPRITQLGKFLRRTRIDELPQLVNVLQGHMALIGPRPEQVKWAQEFSSKIPNYQQRHAVKPGITGLAQVLQGYTDDDIRSTELKVRLDLRYNRDVSFLFDMKIALRTIIVICLGLGHR